jgi:hypothetical protein
MRVYAAHGLDVDGRDHIWPEVRLKGAEMLDLSQPGAYQRRFAIKIFLDMTDGEAAIAQGGKTLRCAFDPQSVPQFGLWINHRGWTPFTSAAPYMNLAFEPCIGAPDTLTDALADWNGAHWIEPGEVKTWSIEWRT